MWLPLFAVRQIVAAMIITLTAIALAGFLQPFVVQVCCLHGRCKTPPRLAALTHALPLAHDAGVARWTT